MDKKTKGAWLLAQSKNLDAVTGNQEARLRRISPNCFRKIDSKSMVLMKRRDLYGTACHSGPRGRARAPGSREPSRLAASRPFGLRSLAHRSQMPAPRSITTGGDGFPMELLREIGVQTLSFSTRLRRGDPHGFAAVIRYRFRRRRRTSIVSVVVSIMMPARNDPSPAVVAFPIRMTRATIFWQARPICARCTTAMAIPACSPPITPGRSVMTSICAMADPCRPRRAPTSPLLRRLIQARRRRLPWHRERGCSSRCEPLPMHHPMPTGRQLRMTCSSL
jgi:hypothetical protein